MSTKKFKVLSVAPATTIISAAMIDRRMDAGCFQPMYLKNEEKLLNGDFPAVQLGTLYKKGNYGSLPDSVDYATAGVALIRGTDLQSMAVNLSDAIRVPDYYYDQFKKAQIKAGDILMLVKGASIDRPDSVAMFPKTDDKSIANGSIFIIRANEKKVNSKYLLAVMTSESFLLQKRRGSSNTGALYNDLDTIKAFIIPLPDSKIQKYIAEKVGFAERCREASREFWVKAMELLSSFIGIQIKDDAFVPKSTKELSSTHYKALSIKPAVSLVNGFRIDNYIGAQFFHPQRSKALLVLENSGVPLKKLSEIANRGKDRINANESVTNNYKYIGLSGIDSNSGQISFDAVEDISGTCALFESGDILFSKLRPYLNKVAICPPEVKRCVGSTELVVYRAKQSVNPYYLFFVLKSPLVLNQVIKITSGSTHPRVDPELIDQAIIPFASDGLQKEIGALCKNALRLLTVANEHALSAKSDIEYLIEGKLDTDAIMSGKLKAPTWEDIEKELEGI